MQPILLYFAAGLTLALVVGIVCYYAAGLSAMLLATWCVGRVLGMLYTVPESEMVDALLKEIDIWEKEETDGGRLKPPDKVKGRMGLPILH